MEHHRWCINRKDLKSLQLQPTHFFFLDTLVKWRLVSAPSLGHHQAVIIRESEYIYGTQNH
jgi:hypothetical protein